MRPPVSGPEAVNGPVTGSLRGVTNKSLTTPKRRSNDHSGYRLAERNAMQYNAEVQEIFWTDEAEAHIWSRHQVTPDEVEQIVYTRPRLVTNGRDNTTYVFGQTNQGRYLLVVLTEAHVGGLYVVTARTMTDKERGTYQRKAR